MGQKKICISWLNSRLQRKINLIQRLGFCIGFFLCEMLLVDKQHQFFFFYLFFFLLLFSFYIYYNVLIKTTIWQKVLTATVGKVSLIEPLLVDIINCSILCFDSLNFLFGSFSRQDSALYYLVREMKCFINGCDEVPSLFFLRCI